MSFPHNNLDIWHTRYSIWKKGTGSREQPDTEHFTEIVVGSDDYPPFSYVDENGDYVGIDVELAEEAFKRLGHNSNKDKTVIQSGRSCINL